VLEGFSMEEVAAMQKATVSAVKSRVHRGRAKLRRHYQRLGLGPQPTVDPDVGGAPLLRFQETITTGRGS
jgi:hypothetical protein